MFYIGLGALGFLLLHLFDIVCLKKLPGAKPVIWFLGSGLLGYALIQVALAPHKLPLPWWLTGLGYSLLGLSLCLLIYSLFINLPFRKTYVARGIGDRLITTGLYALVRHPGVLSLSLTLLSLTLVSGSRLLVIATPLWISLDILLVVIQDRFFLGRMFPGYADYRRQTPMLVPNRKSLSACITQLRYARGLYPGGRVEPYE